MIIPVSDLSLPELSLYASANETKLKHFYEPEPGLFIVETANVIIRAMKAGYEPVSLFLEERFVSMDPETTEKMAGGLQGALAAEAGNTLETQRTVKEILEKAGDIPVYTAPLDVISTVSGFKQTRGVMALMKRKPLPSLEEILKDAKRIAVLEDVENPTNVGAIFRSASALGLDAVILTFRSADPFYRRASRVSMGGVFSIPWTFVGNKYGGWPVPGMKLLKELGYKTVSLALDDRAVPLDDLVLQGEEKLAILLGNEENGLLKETLKETDYTAIIPMQHEMDSLNVAAAAAVAFWELRKK